MARACSIWLLVLCGCAPEPPMALGIAAGCNPLASTSECLYPYPSRFFQASDSSTVTHVRNAFPQGILQTPSTVPAIDMTPFNRYDGHSPSAPLLVHLGVDVSPDQLVGQSDNARMLDPQAPI